MAEEIVIGKLIIDNTDLDRAMLDSKRAVIELENEQKKLKKETEGLSEANEEQLTTFIANEASLKRLRGEYSANQKSVLAIMKAQTGLDSELSKTVKTEEQAIANTKALTEARKKIDTTTVEGSKAIADINNKIDKNNKLIKESGSALEQQKGNVGNYPTIMAGVSSSFGDAGRSIVGFGQQGKQVIGELSGTVTNLVTVQRESTIASRAYAAAQLAETQATEIAAAANERATVVGFRRAQGTATEAEAEIANTAATIANTAATEAQATATIAGTTATTAATAASKGLKIAMLAIPLVLLLSLLAPLISFLTSTQEGMDAITSVTRPLVAIFQSFIGVLQNVGKQLFDTFTNPKKAMNDLYEFVVQNLINRFKAFGVILQGIIELDFGKLSDGVLQAGTGVENLTGKIANAGKQTAAFLKEAADRGKEIDRLTKNIEIAEININKQTQENITKRKELDKIVKNTSLNIKDRTKANEEQNQLARDQAKIESGILEMKIKRLVIEQKLNDTSRKGNKELADLEAEREKINQGVIDEELAGTKVIATAKKEAAAEAKSASDKAKAESLKQARNRIDLLKLESAQQDLNADQRIANAKKIFDLENDLAKRSSTGTDQQKLLLQNKQNLSSEILAIAEDQINKELEAQKKYFAENKKLSEEQRDALLLSANDLATAQILLLDKSLLSEKAYADEVVKINQGKNDSITIANTAFEEAQKERDKIEVENQKMLSEVAFQIRLQDIADKDATEQEIKESLLAENYARELELLNESLANKDISEEAYLRKRSLAEKKYNSQTKANDKILADQKRANTVTMANQIIGSLQALFGESKALSIASALMNTYEGITTALKAPTLPQRIAGVAFASATGFAAVRNILKTQKTSSGSGGESAPQVTSGAGSFVNSQTSTIATVTDKPVEQNTVVSPPVLVLETLQEVQNNVLIKVNSDD